METLIEKVNELKYALEKTEEVKEIKKIQEEMKKDKTLCKLLQEFKQSNKEQTRQEIYTHPLFQKYKESETNLNLLIWKINNQLTSIRTSDKDENN